MTAAELTPVNTSLADLATQRANAALVAQRAEREAKAARDEAEQREKARQLEEGIKAMEEKRRIVPGIGTSPGNRSGLSRELAVPGDEYTTHPREDNSNVEQFGEAIKLGDKTFTAVRLSCPQSSMSHRYFNHNSSYSKLYFRWRDWDDISRGTVVSWT